MKKAFYFILKALFVLKIFKFLSRRFGHIGKMDWLERSGTMQFCELIEYNKRNIFLQKLCVKWCRETSFRPLFIFLKSLIWGERKVVCSLDLLYFDCPQLVIQ